MDVPQHIRDLMNDGQLSWPQGVSVRFVAGTGEDCFICRTPVAPSTRQATVTAPSVHLRMHAGCLRLWAEEISH